SSKDGLPCCSIFLLSEEGGRGNHNNGCRGAEIRIVARPDQCSTPFSVGGSAFSRSFGRDAGEASSIV
ncbi:MAG: hypothetical protein KKA99_06990, partial [Gammaproteobacteria bacterium]|nr:hypothetical protein [Gammaproteobacteria bacterium]